MELLGVFVFDDERRDIGEVRTKRQLSRFSLSKDGLFPLFFMVISENGKIVWRLVVTATILLRSEKNTKISFLSLKSTTQNYEY